MSNPNSQVSMAEAKHDATNGKMERARIISAQLLELVQSRGRGIPACGGAGKRNSLCYIDDRFRLVLTPGCSITLASRAGNLVEERRIFKDEGDLLELEVSKRRKLALHIFRDDIEIIEFVPGPWEQWFGADQGADFTPYRIPLVPKRLGELKAWPVFQQGR